MSTINDTKVAVALYLAKPAPTLADLMMIVDSVDDAHSRVLEAKGHAIQSAQVEVDECDEREKSHQEALLSVQAQIGEEVRRAEKAYQTRKELEAVVPRIPSATTKELQGLGSRPSSRRKRTKEHLAQGGVHDVAPESAVIGSGV